MENLLNQIRGVVGVSGVIIYDRIHDEARHILPASLDDQFADTFHSKFGNFLQFAPANTKARIKLAHGWAIISATERHGILVLAKDELNISTLNLVLKSILVALEHDKGGGGQNGEVIFNEESVFTLVRTINLIVDHFSDTVSRFQIAQFLRDSKGQLIDHYPDLKRFTVEHNGQVVLIKGSETVLNEQSVDAVATWMAQFKKLIKEQTVVAGFNLKSITTEIRGELESLKFYRKFQKLSG